MTLVEFYMSYESAMDAQRYNQEKLNVSSLHMIPQLKTPLPIEKHASESIQEQYFFYFNMNFISLVSRLIFKVLKKK